ncbi:MAG: SUMF1/EgtB/PvdO family nonheme iron enzyme [Deltaproteobacteria bacterium]|nr:SUMF1/EgtB/PvdO family nonheme iron enzyme [Deltaproteobacteria bacterium]
MSVVHSSAISVRHAIARALATHNRSPADATWRVLSARAAVDARGRVTRADVTIRVEEPVAALADSRARGLVNPTGQHPLMAMVPGRSDVLLDVLPVSFDRWLRVKPGSLPGDIDPWTARTGIEHAEASAWARAAGKRLPTVAEFRAAWGTGRFPWGEQADPSQGIAAPLRYGEVPEVALLPPNKHGFFDLGCAIWHWTDDGQLLGGEPGLVAGGPGAAPCGLRCAQEL